MAAAATAAVATAAAATAAAPSAALVAVGQLPLASVSVHFPIESTAHTVRSGQEGVQFKARSSHKQKQKQQQQLKASIVGFSLRLLLDLVMEFQKNS